ncbi:hypothetical protein AD428_18185 [Achromobacter sp. DMS1]|nr:hypothetical protein AD428_18185 [Achromobacter sp. DMS1]
MRQGLFAQLAPAFAGQAHALVGQHGLDQCFHPFQIGFVAGQRVRVDGQEGLAESGGSAFVHEERFVLEAEARSGERAHQQFHDEGQHGAFHAAGRQHAAGQAGLGIGGGPAFGCRNGRKWRRFTSA